MTHWLFKCVVGFMHLDQDYDTLTVDVPLALNFDTSATENLVRFID